MRKWSLGEVELICPGSQSKEVTGQDPEPLEREHSSTPRGPAQPMSPPTLPLSCCLEPHLTLALLHPKAGNKELACRKEMPAPGHPRQSFKKIQCKYVLRTLEGKCPLLPWLVMKMQMSGSIQFIDSWAGLSLATPHPSASSVSWMSVSQTWGFTNLHAIKRQNTGMDIELPLKALRITIPGNLALSSRN